MKTILISGGAVRLGAALVKRFYEKGNHIVFLYNSSEEQAKRISATYAGVKAVYCNLRETKSISAAYTEAESFYGVPDVLINNSGVFPAPVDIESLTEENWDLAMDVNLKGHFFLSKQYYSALKSRNQNGKIINIASLGGVEIWDRKVQYNVSKSALITLTKAMARNMAPIASVNCISPGSLDLTEKSEYEDSPYIDKNRIPMKRHGNADDIFQVADFFANCSDYITGQNIIVDGGFNLIK